VRRLYTRTGSPLALQAYLACLNSKEDVQTTASGDLSKTAVLQATYTPQDRRVNKPLQIDVTYTNGTVQQSKNGVLKAAAASSSARVKPGNTATFVLNRTDPKQASNLSMAMQGIGQTYNFTVPAESPTCTHTESAQFSVPANVAWWNSNFSIKPGEILTISVTGSDSWTLSGANYGNYPSVNADGWDWSSITRRDPGLSRDKFVNPQEAPGALLYRIGENGSPIHLGTAGVSNIEIDQPGNLFFTMNDDLRTPPASLGFTDNSGAIGVQVHTVETLANGSPQCN
jgi:hypothetical protein